MVDEDEACKAGLPTTSDTRNIADEARKAELPSAVNMDNNTDCTQGSSPNPNPNPNPISPSRFQHRLHGYYYFAMANTSNNVRFQIFVAKPVLADMLLHTSTSLLSMMQI